MSFSISVLAAALYLITAVLLYRSLSYSQAGSNNLSENKGPSDTENLQAAGSVVRTRTRRIRARWIASVAFILHGWVVVQHAGFPSTLTLPLFTAIAAAALIVVFLLIILCWQQPADYLGIAVYPIAAISIIGIHNSPDSASVLSEAIQVHVFLSLLAYAVLTLAAAQAVLVSIQRHHLARHKPGGFIRSLPALDSTEDLLFTLLTTGFFLLSLSLFSGFFYLEDMFAQHLVHKTVLSCVAWAIFAVLLFGRWRFGWRGQKAVQWTLAGFAILILAYFGSKIVLEILLR